MKRIKVPPRENWQKRLEVAGFTFHSIEGIYWNEGVGYEFTSDEIDRIESATAELQKISLEAVQYVMDKDLFDKLSIKGRAKEMVLDSWAREDKSVYGRFDLCYDNDVPRLLEYNADTPTSLVESSIAQWVWLEDMFPQHDQFNSIHEKLMDAFREVSGIVGDGIMHFTCVQDSEEDLMTTEYMRDMAVQCGIETKHIFIEDIGFAEKEGCFADLDNNVISFLFKLYPWEWLMNDDFGRHVTKDNAVFFEPAWKMVLSNKGILPVLWEMYPGHPNLLPCYFDPSGMRTCHVKKPLLSREGANVELVGRYGSREATGGAYGAEGYVYQEEKRLPSFDGNYAVVGSWVINGLPAGIGIREDNSPITQNTSRFV
ncbi:MAG TPA: glutathionylspermidine synthase family protein, partial [Thermodesulfovibrionales bacterium]|nr:glutathionylspermidine synthase family protein [Thermodesulfovibrionales bacterium]